jgi:uncharacterized protein YkwD
VIRLICGALLASSVLGCVSPTRQENGVQSGGGEVLPTLPAPSPSTTGVLDSEESAFFTLINQYRAANALPLLQLSADLTLAAHWMSTDMATHNNLDHTDSLGRDPFTRMEDFGYVGATSMGENIAAGNETGQDTLTQWQNSPPHNANMLDADYLAIGVGRAYDAASEYGWYWTTDFGSETGH